MLMASAPAKSTGKLVNRNEVAREASAALRQYTLVVLSKSNATAPEPVIAASVLV
jgi:hypothetical protein